MWIAPAEQAFVSVAGGASVIIGSFNPVASIMAHPTIVRTRGTVGVKPASFGADIGIIGAWGVGVVSDEAFAAGTASIPRPFEDADWNGWLAWGVFIQQLEFADATGRLYNAVTEYSVDSKAMRKIPPGNTLVEMAESQTGAFEVNMSLRLLFLLS